MYLYVCAHVCMTCVGVNAMFLVGKSEANFVELILYFSCHMGSWNLSQVIWLVCYALLLVEPSPCPLNPKCTTCGY